MIILKSVCSLFLRIVIIFVVIQSSFLLVRHYAPAGHPYAPQLSLSSIVTDSDLGTLGGTKLIACYILITLWHALIIILLASVACIVIGVCLSRMPWLKIIVTPVSDFFRKVPVSLMYPIAIISFSISSDALLICLCTIPCSAIMILAVTRGLENIDPERVAIYKLNNNENDGWKLFFYYKLRVIIPELCSGLKFIISYALVLAVVLEMLGLGQPDSAGRIISHAADDRVGNLSGTPLTLIVALGLISYGLNLLSNHVETIYGKHRF